MQSAFIIGVTEWFLTRMQECCSANGIAIYKTLSRHPAPPELFQLLSVFSPEIVFLEVTYSRRELELLREIQTCYPRIAIIGFGESSDMPPPAGVHQFLAAPFSPEAFQRAVRAAAEFQRAAVPDNIFAFVPAKAGSGATTLALCVSRYLAQRCQKRVLLVEADIHSGPISFLLDVKPERSIVDALENCHRLDEPGWQRLVTKADGFDLLPAPPSIQPAHLMQWSCRRLLTYVRTHYDAVLVDLPEVVNDATEAVVTECRKLHVICTPEKASVLLARRRIYELAARGAKAHQLALVLNRHASDNAAVENIEQLIGRQAAHVVPNDYPAAQQVRSPRPVEELSRFGRAISSLARGIGGLPVAMERSRTPWFRRLSA